MLSHCNTGQLPFPCMLSCHADIFRITLWFLEPQSAWQMLSIDVSIANVMGGRIKRVRIERLQCFLTGRAKRKMNEWAPRIHLHIDSVWTTIKLIWFVFLNVLHTKSIWTKCSGAHSFIGSFIHTILFSFGFRALLAGSRSHPTQRCRFRCDYFVLRYCSGLRHLM